MASAKWVLGVCIVGLFACGGPNTPLTPTPPAGPSSPPNATCSIALDVDSATFDASGGRTSATVKTEAGCLWTLDAGTNAWIRPDSGGPFVGPSRFTVTIEPNRSLSSRSAIFAVKGADQTVAARTLSQRAAGCLYSVNPTTQTFDAIGTYYPGEPPSFVGVGVHAEPAECRWTVESMPSWLELARFSARGGTGDGSIWVIVAPNTGASRRLGDLVVAGLSGVNPDARFTVVQTAR